jgi:endonuclease/exonuclease/phosphatase family metal-dependent hydrolase
VRPPLIGLGAACLISLLACSSSESDPPPDRDVTVATLNVLHGASCPFNSDSCRLFERLELAFQWVKRLGCPDVIALQEVSDGGLKKIESLAAATCSFPYSVTRTRSNGIDDEAVLSRYPVESSNLDLLLGDFRTVLHVRVRHPRGPVDVLTTHLSSQTDKGDEACGPNCPAECNVPGATSKRDCQAIQLARLANQRKAEGATVVVTGDMNFRPSDFGYKHFIDTGWVDTYLSSGSPECDASGRGCTSGRADEVLTDLESPSSKQSSRIDFIFTLKANAACEVEAAGDADRDGTPTAIFPDVPNPFAATCGARPAAICWPSDHSGIVADLNCR